MHEILTGVLLGIVLAGAAAALLSRHHPQAANTASAPSALPPELLQLLSFQQRTLEALVSRPAIETELLQDLREMLREAQDRALVMTNPLLLRTLYQEAVPKFDAPQTQIEQWREALKVARAADLRRQAAQELGERIPGMTRDSRALDPDLANLDTDMALEQEQDEDPDELDSGEVRVTHVSPPRTSFDIRPPRPRTQANLRPIKPRLVAKEEAAPSAAPSASLDDLLSTASAEAPPAVQ